MFGRSKTFNELTLEAAQKHYGVSLEGQDSSSSISPIGLIMVVFSSLCLVGGLIFALVYVDSGQLSQVESDGTSSQPTEVARESTPPLESTPYVDPATQWGVVAAEDILMSASLPTSYQFYKGPKIPVSRLPAGQVGWVPATAVANSGGRTVIQVERSTITGEYVVDERGLDLVSYGPKGINQLLVVNTGHGLEGFLFPSTCGEAGSLENLRPPVGKALPVTIGAPVEGLCAYPEY